MYTDHELIEKLIDYYNRFNKSPTKREFKKPNFTTYVNHFGSWNNALEAAGLPLNHNVTNTPNICRICKTTKAISWYNQNGYKVCNKCNNRDRNYFYGILDPNSNTGIAVTTEHVCFKVLNDCIKCNTINNFNSQFDLISEKYDNDRENAEPYGCGNMRFFPKLPTEDILNKYNISVSEYDEIAEHLEMKLSFGSCGWCT